MKKRAEAVGRARNPEDHRARARAGLREFVAQAIEMTVRKRCGARISRWSTGARAGDRRRVPAREGESERAASRAAHEQTIAPRESGSKY